MDSFPLIGLKGPGSQDPPHTAASHRRAWPDWSGWSEELQRISTVPVETKVLSCFFKGTDEETCRSQDCLDTLDQPPRWTSRNGRFSVTLFLNMIETTKVETLKLPELSLCGMIAPLVVGCSNDRCCNFMTRPPGFTIIRAAFLHFPLSFSQRW